MITVDGYMAAETKTVTIESGETLAYREVGSKELDPARAPAALSAARSTAGILR